MNILFRYVPPKQNKGLAMQIVPRLLEGWEAKYITGSGQTAATAARVRIYETEGCIKPSHRTKLKRTAAAAAATATAIVAAQAVESEPSVITIATAVPELHTKKRIKRSEEDQPVALPPPFGIREHSWPYDLEKLGSSAKLELKNVFSWDDSLDDNRGDLLGQPQPQQNSDEIDIVFSFATSASEEFFQFLPLDE